MRLARELAGDHWRTELLRGFRAAADLLGEPDVAAQVDVVARALLGQPVLRAADLDRLCGRVRP